MAIIASWQKVYGYGINNLGTDTVSTSDATTTTAPISQNLFTAGLNLPGWYIGELNPATISSASTNQASMLYGTKTVYIMGKGDFWQFLPNNVPNLDPGQEIIEKEKALGKPFRDNVEYQAGVKGAKTSIEMDVTVEEIIPFLWTFCGSFGQKATSDHMKIFIPYAKRTATADYTDASWDFLTGTFNTLFEFDDFRDHDYDGNSGVTMNIYEYIPSETYVSYLSAAVPSSMNFSSSENEAVTVSMELNGHSIQTDTTWHSGSASDNRSSTPNIITPLLHQDAVCLALIETEADFSNPDHQYIDGELEYLNVKSMSLNLSTNPGIDFFNSQNIQAIVNQRFSGTLEMQIQWDGTDNWKDAHENNEYALLNFIWDKDSSGIAVDGSLTGSWGTGDFGIGVVVRITSCERTNEAQVMENITGEVVTAGEYTPIMFKLADSVEWTNEIQD